MKAKIFSLFLLLLSGPWAFAIDIPKGLSPADQEDVVKILGLGTSVKMATSPYPLGGYSGFEFGLDVSFINIDQLTRLGCEPGSPGCANQERSDAQEFSYAKLTVGKGLYESIDLFFSFAPFLSGSDLSDFGGSLRWTFYEARLLPIHLLLHVSGNNVNFKNDFVSQNLGADLLVGVNVEDLSIYFGGGQIRSEGVFIAGTGSDATVILGTEGVNPGTNTVTRTIHRFHTVVGASFELNPLFIAGEINRYEDSVYTLKTGIRF